MKPKELLFTLVLTLFNAILSVVLIKSLSSGVLNITTLNALFFLLIIILGFICGYSSRLYIILLEALTITLIIIGTSSILQNINFKFVIQYLVVNLVIYSAAAFFALRKKGMLERKATNHTFHITLLLNTLRHSLRDFIIEIIGLIGVLLITYYVLSMIISLVLGMKPYLLLGYLITITNVIYSNIYSVILIISLIVIITIYSITSLSLSKYTFRISNILKYLALSLITYFIPLSLPLTASALRNLALTKVSPREISQIRLSKHDFCFGKIIKSIDVTNKDDELCINLEKGKNNHILVVGATGSGKTTLVKKILEQLESREDIRYLVIDVHGEYNDLKAMKINPRINKVNILDIGVEDKNELINEVTDLISEVFKLGNIQIDHLKRVLSILLSLKENPSITDLIRLIEKIINNKELQHKYNLDSSTLKSIIPYMMQLQGISGKEFEWINASDIVGKNIIVNLGQINNKHIAKIYAEIITRMIFNYAKKNYGSNYRYVIVFEEVHNFISKKTGIDVVTKILREGRKFNLNLIAITQAVHDIPEAPLSNFRWVVMLPSLLQSQYLSLIKSIMGESPSKEVKELINKLKLGYSLVVRQDSKGVYYIKTYISE